MQKLVKVNVTRKAVFTTNLEPNLKEEKKKIVNIFDIEILFNFLYLSTISDFMTFSHA